MNMKTLIWAGVGLFLSMTITTIWISRDLATIRAHNKQRQLAECARKAQDPGSAMSTTTAVGTTGAVVDPLAAQTGTGTGSPTAAQPSAPAAKTACPTPPTATANATAANGQAPATAGATDAYGNTTGQAQPASQSQYQDPNAAYAASAQPDQYGGQQQYQPQAQAQQPATSTPTYAPTDVGGAAS